MKYCCLYFSAHVKCNFFRKRTPNEYFKSGWTCRVVEIYKSGNQIKNQYGWNIVPMSHCLFCGSKLS